MKDKTLKEAGEYALLRSIRQKWRPKWDNLLVGMGDDTAIFAPGPGSRALVTCDMLAEGVHFRRSWTKPAQLGYKALAVNLSDIAAMGGTPRLAWVALALPPSLSLAWAEEFYAGFAALADTWQVDLAGGDTCASTDKITICVTLYGESGGEVLLRSGSSPGDKILVSGALGDAAAGLAILEEKKGLPRDPYLLERFLRPTPRLREGRLITRSGLATAMLDISDGLAMDLRNLSERSRVGVKVFLHLLPTSPQLREKAPRLEKEAPQYAFYGGEDYELLLTAPENSVATLQQILAECSCPLTVIGETTTPERGLLLLDERGRSLPWPEGYSHF